MSSNREWTRMNTTFLRRFNALGLLSPNPRPSAVVHGTFLPFFA